MDDWDELRALTQRIAKLEKRAGILLGTIAGMMGAAAMVTLAGDGWPAIVYIPAGLVVSVVVAKFLD